MPTNTAGMVSYDTTNLSGAKAYNQVAHQSLKTVRMYNPADGTDVWVIPELANHMSGLGFKNITSSTSAVGKYTTPGVAANGTIGEGTRLQHYTQPTDVPLGAEQRQLIDYLGGELSNPNSSLRQVLSGTPNWGQFQSGIAEPMQRAYQEQALPGINNQYSGSGTGSSFFSGARQNEQQDAQNKLQQNLAQLRYQEQQGATTNMLGALGQMPAINSVLADVTTNDKANMTRKLETYYKNQGLTSDQARADLASFQATVQQQDLLAKQAMEKSRFGLQQDQFNYAKEQNALAQAKQLEAQNKQAAANQAALRAAQDKAAWYNSQYYAINGGDRDYGQFGNTTYSGGGVSTRVYAPASWSEPIGGSVESNYQEALRRQQLQSAQNTAAAIEAQSYAASHPAPKSSTATGVYGPDGTYKRYS